MVALAAVAWAATSTARPQEPGPPAPDGAPAARPPASAADVELKGRVIDAAGTPVKGAATALSAPPGWERRAIATSGDDGRFRAKVASWGNAKGVKVVASLRGRGAGWADVGRGDLAIRLPDGSGPIEGRVVGPEGQPVAGATARVIRVGRRAGDEDLTRWIDQVVRGKFQGRFWYEEGLDTLEARALDVPTKAMTDAAGWFRLDGLGGDRVVTLLVRGPGIAITLFGVITRPGPIAGLQPGHRGIYPARFDHVVGPEKPVVGTVLDKKTGEPLAGIAFQEAFETLCRATTDARGRYRLEGLPKQPSYPIAASPGAGRPYFGSRTQVQDGPGLEPLTVDFELERGLELNGRLVDRRTREPIQGHVFNVARDNPLRLEYKSDSEAARTGPDGSFRLVAIPGPGTLVACADAPEDYVFIDAKKRLAERKTLGCPTAPAAKLVEINPSEDDPRSLAPTIDLRPGRVVRGVIVGPDGRPVDGA